MLRSAFVAAFILALFGCGYSTTEERDGTATRLVENDGACPPADTIEVPGYITDADRTAWHRIDMPPLCFYRMPKTERFSACTHATKALADIQGDDQIKKDFAPALEDGTVRTEADTFRCTTDHGEVFVVQGAPDCAATERGGDLVLQVDRQPYRFCKYETTEEYTSHPFSCGSTGVFAP